MQTGQILHRFTANDGQEVILRTLKWEDIDDLNKIINALIDEGADIPFVKPVTRDEQIDWMGKRLGDAEKGKVLTIVAEVNDRVIAITDIKIQTGFRSHVGDLGIIMLKEYRDLGIGTEMLKLLIAQARDKSVKLVTLYVFSTNTRAIHVYEKLGFHECGRIPGEFVKNGKYIDRITMIKRLGDLS